MTTKEAAERSGKSINTIRKLCKEQLIPGAIKRSNKWIIPDETRVILDRMEIKTVLIQIIKYKNNPCVVVSRKLFHNDQVMSETIKLLYKLGLIGDYEWKTEIKELFSSIMLTDEGLKMVIPERRTFKLGSISVINVKIGLINT